MNSYKKGKQMKKIAMLNCLKANEVCTGAACMKAYNEKTRSFERYQGEETEVTAFMRCNGCDAHPGEDKGLQEKIDRLVKEGVQAVHAGVCTKDRQGNECQVITEILSDMENKGIEVIRGTH